MVLLDLRGPPFLEEAQRFCPDGQISASSRKDPSQPPEFLKSPKVLEDIVNELFTIDEQRALGSSARIILDALNQTRDGT